MSFLIPIGVVVYAAIGGLKATFTTSYLHTVIVFLLCLIFMFKVYVPGGFLNGIDDVSLPTRLLTWSSSDVLPSVSHGVCLLRTPRDRPGIYELQLPSASCLCWVH